MINYSELTCETKINEFSGYLTRCCVCIMALLKVTSEADRQLICSTMNTNQG